MINKNKTLILVLAVAVIVIGGAFIYMRLQPQTNTETPSQTDNKAAALEEVSRLTALAGQETITVEDLETLEGLVHEDEPAEHEMHEIETLIKYQEYSHVAHTLGFLGEYINTGKESLCPAHMLAHYYVFSKHGETEMADEALEEAEEQLPEWESEARKYNEKYPSGQDFDELVNLINSHIESIESGDSSATDEEINFLINNGICV